MPSPSASSERAPLVHPDGAGSGPFAAALAALAAATAVLAGWGLGASALWYDEAASSYASRVTGRELTAWLAVDANMWAHHLLLRVWRLVAGDGEAALRVPSVVAAAATVVVVGVLGRRWFGARIGLVAAALLTVDPWTIRYAREARSYTAVLLVVALSLLVLDVAERHPERVGPRVAWTVLAVVGMYLHLWMAFVLVGEVAAAARAEHRPLVDAMRRRGPELVAVLLLSAPLLWYAAGSGQLSWLPVPAPVDAVTVAALLGGWAVLGLVLLVLAGVGGWRLFRDGGPALPRELLAWTVVVPIVPPVLLSFVHPVFHPRYLIVCLPAVALAAAVGIGVLDRRSRVMGAAVTGIVLVALFAASVGIVREGPLEDWRGVVEHVAAGTDGGRGTLLVVSPDFATLALQEQLLRRPLPGADVYDPAVGCPGATADLDACLRDRSTVWVVERSDSDRRTDFDPPAAFLGPLADEGWRPGPTVELAHLRLTPWSAPR